MAGYDRSAFNNMNMEIPYLGAETVDISSTDHTFTKGPVRGIDISGAGDINLQYEDLSEQVRKIVVATDDETELRGRLIKAVLKTSTTCTGMTGLY